MADLTRKIASFLMGDILGRGLAFITSVYLARTLGAEGFGLITIALSFLGYVAFFGDFGLHHIGIRETAKLKEKQGFNTTEIFIARIILGFLAFGIGFTIIPFLKFSDVQVQLIKGFIYALGAYAFLLEWYFQQWL
ncbi:MAG: oligosaccharide flippase family protein [Balneolales bacterium]|nr:oligosaccharide flippase family protein [Balneolales bacterium]